MDFEIEGDDDVYDFDLEVEEPTWKSKPKNKNSAGSKTNSSGLGYGITANQSLKKSGHFSLMSNSLDNDDVYNYDFDDDNEKSHIKRGSHKSKTTTSSAPVSPGFTPLPISKTVSKETKEIDPNRKSVEAADAILSKYANKTAGLKNNDVGKYSRKYVSSNFDEDDISVSSDDKPKLSRAEGTKANSGGLERSITSTNLHKSQPSNVCRWK